MQVWILPIEGDKGEKGQTNKNLTNYSLCIPIFLLTYADLHEILKTADIISLHLPLTPQTENLIGQAKLEQMKGSALFFNVGHGKLVDEKALTAALREKKIAGAGIDVFRVEPITSDNPLIGLDNVVLSPHVSSVTLGFNP